MLRDSKIASLSFAICFIALLTIGGCGYVAEQHLVEMPPVTEVSIIPSEFLSLYDHDTLVTIKVEVTNSSFKNLSPAEGVIWKLIHQARDLGADAITGVQITPCYTHLSVVNYRLAFGEATAVIVHSDEVHKEFDSKKMITFVRMQSNMNPPAKNIPIIFSGFLQSYKYRPIKTVAIKLDELQTDESKKTEEALIQLLNLTRLAGGNAMSELKFKTHETGILAEALAVEQLPKTK